MFGPEFAIESVPAETENPASKLINCGAVNKVLTRFYQQHSNGSAWMEQKRIIRRVNNSL